MFWCFLKILDQTTYGWTTSDWNKSGLKWSAKIIWTKIPLTAHVYLQPFSIYRPKRYNKQTKKCYFYRFCSGKNTILGVYFTIYIDFLVVYSIFLHNSCLQFTQTGKFIGNYIWNICSLTFIPVRGRGVIRTGGPDPKKHYFMPIYAYILQFMLMFSSYTPYFSTTLVNKASKLIWKCLCNTCSFIYPS